MNLTKISAWVAVLAVVAVGAYLFMTRETGPASPSFELANPASTNCLKEDGQLEIVDEAGGQVGYCHLPGGQTCEEWALYRGECTASVPPLASDLLPLYASVSWGAPRAATMGDLSGTRATSSPIMDITNIAAATKPFETYYRDKLVAAGWKVDISREAGGPGALVEAYQKGSAHILYGFTTVFKGTKPGEPVQCPCDTSFFVFSD